MFQLRFTLSYNVINSCSMMNLWRLSITDPISATHLLHFFVCGETQFPVCERHLHGNQIQCSLTGGKLYQEQTSLINTSRALPLFDLCIWFMPHSGWGDRGKHEEFGWDVDSIIVQDVWQHQDLASACHGTGSITNRRDCLINKLIR